MATRIRKKIYLSRFSEVRKGSPKELLNIDREQIRRPDKFHGPDEEFTENPIAEETISFEQLIRKCK